MLKVALIGPESTGKTTLAGQLATHYKGVWVSEFARQYIDDLKGKPYTYEELLIMAKGQLALENKMAATKPAFLFIDTEMTVIKIWSENAYQKCDPWILEAWKNQDYDLYLLMSVDLPWEEDPQRVFSDLATRQHLFESYKQHLHQKEAHFKIISGKGKTRFENAIQAVEALKPQTHD